MTLGTFGLPLRSAVIARRRRRLRILAALSAFCLIGLVAAAAREVWPHRAKVIATVSSMFTSPTPGPTPVAEPEPARPVYRHSIVPGGAYSRAEIADAISKDAVVAAHYQDIDVDKVHATTAGVARAVYVSYRVGNQVYWTKNRVRLAAGETLLTDGDTEIRARCGNLVSDHAQQPVAAAEPPLAALDEPETGSSTMAGARGPDGTFAHLPPFLGGPHGASSMAFEGLDPAAGQSPSLDAPMWFGGGGGMSPHLGSSTGTSGTSPVAPRGNSERNNNGGGSNGGGSNGGGSNGGGSNGGGPGGGGGGQPPLFVPLPTIDETPFTTTGSTETSTAGDEMDETADGEIPTVPEPGTLVLLGLGACGVVARAVRSRRRNRA